jgi:hypothetical protein
MMAAILDRVRRPLVWAAIALAVLAQWLVLSEGPWVWRAWAALALTALAPGLLLVEWWVGAAEDRPQPAEFLLYAVGAGYALTVMGMLVLTYLPGRIERWQTLALFDGLIAVLAALILLRRRPVADDSTAGRESVSIGWLPQTQRAWWLAGALAILLVGGFLRFADLGYSEFQGDEARAMLRSAETIQNYRDALLGHKKGPAEILIPTAIYSLVDHMTEAMARLPFAVANMAGLFALWLLGRRLFGPVAGWAAAMLLALDGYFIGFARIVQYQSLVFLMDVLVVLAMYRLVAQARPRGRKHPPGHQCPGYRTTPGEPGLPAGSPLDRALFPGQTAFAPGDPSLTRYLTLAAIFLATGLLAHYEAALAALPAAYLLYAIWRRGVPLGMLARAMIVPVLVGGAMLASFYVPFVLNPGFESTYNYITVNRIGGSFPYNNLVDFWERTILYSSSYYVLLMIAATALGLALIYRRNLPSAAGWIVTAALAAGLVLSFLRPSWIRFDESNGNWLLLTAAVFAAAIAVALLARLLPQVWIGVAGWLAAALLAAGVLIPLSGPVAAPVQVPAAEAAAIDGAPQDNTPVETETPAAPAPAVRDHTWLFFAAVLAVAWLLPRFSTEERVAWLWFGAPAILMLFFTLTPNTHVYGFFMGWALIAGALIGRGWQALRDRIGISRAQWAVMPAALLTMALFANYEYWFFAATDLEVLRTWRENRPRGYWISYEMPTRMSIFGFPLKNGWKVAGVLYATGILDAPYDLHGKPPVSEWYTRGMGYCPRDHLYYLWHESVEPADQGYNTVVRQQIEEKGYQLFGTAMVNGLPRLRIYKLSDAPLTPQEFDISAYEAVFDEVLSGPIFEKIGPATSPSIQNPLDLHFGEAIRLKGFHVYNTETHPGGAVSLTLYWQAVQQIPIDYSVFTQVIDMSDFYKAGQRDGEPGCNEWPTDFWVPGDIIVDRYDIPIAPDARPGAYTLLIGMYDNDNGERLDIFSPEGQPLGDQIGLIDIVVQPQ